MGAPTPLLLALILYSAAVAAAAGAGRGAPASRLSGMFVALGGNSSWGAVSWSQQRWAQAYADMAAVGIDSVVLTSAVRGRVALYNSSLPALSRSPYGDVLGRALAAAAAARPAVRVHVGLVLDNDYFHQNKNVTYLEELRDLNLAVLDELSAMHGAPMHGAPIVGYYQAAELCRLDFTEPAQAAAVMATLVEPVGARVHKLDPALVYSNAPFYGNKSTPADVARWFDAALPLAPSVDALFFQDSVGTGHVREPAGALPYYAALAPVAVRHNVTFGDDVEIFHRYPHYGVAPWARVQEQLEGETPYVAVGARVAFEYSNYMDPRSGIPDAVALYRAYAAYVGTSLGASDGGEGIVVVPPPPSPQAHLKVRSWTGETSVTHRSFTAYVAVVEATRTFGFALWEDGCHVYRNASQTAALSGCTYATNGGFFQLPGSDCIGNIIIDGKVLRVGPQSEQNHASFGVFPNGSTGVGLITAADDVTKFGFSQLLSGKGWIVRDGNSNVLHSPDLDPSSSFVNEKAPRTGVGVCANGTIALLQVDGEEDIDEGFDLWEFSQLFMDLGVTQAVNLDGGGSSVSVYRDKVISRPTCDDTPVEVSAQLAPSVAPLCFRVAADPCCWP